MSTTTTKNGTTESLRSTLLAWQSKAVHTVTCPSGQKIKIVMPGLAALLERGELPSELVPVALLDFTAEAGVNGAIADALTDETKSQEEVMASLAGFTGLQRFLACKAIVAVQSPDGEWLDVTIPVEDADLFPEDDLAMIAEIVQRLRAHDAVGVTVGVEPLDRWATFREEHRCPEDCEACARVVSTLSSVYMDPV